MGVLKYFPVDFIFTCAGVVFILLDIGLDIWAAVSFYQEKAYWSLGILLLLLIGSSILVQAYSWLWYSYDNFERHTEVEKLVSPSLLRLLHVFQLGIYCRHAGAAESSLHSFRSKNHDHEGVAVYQRHDLSMLRLIETFSESAPQLVLMLTIILQRGELDPVTVGKTVGSVSAIAFRLTMHYHLLGFFLPNKQRHQKISLLIFFFWNLFLISSRLTALALFASVLPCFIFTHFLCSWMVLFFFVWRSKTDFMDSVSGEWLYRATVGLIWYFDWLNVAEGRTRFRTLLYHGYILVDISLLCGLWCWKMSTEPPDFEIPPPYAVITAVSVVGVYMLGLLFKMIYYKYCHPSRAKEELKGDTTERSQVGQGPTRSILMTTSAGDETDFPISPEDLDLSVSSPGDEARDVSYITPNTTILREDADEDVTDCRGTEHGLDQNI